MAPSLGVPAETQTRTTRVMSTENNFNDPMHYPGSSQNACPRMAMGVSRNTEPRSMPSATMTVPAVNSRHRRALGLCTHDA
jgi:hypothetical protein